MGLTVAYLSSGTAAGAHAMAANVSVRRLT